MVIKGLKKDLSEFSEEERYDIARQVLKYAPYTIDTETFKAYSNSIKSATENVAFCERQLKGLKEVGVESARIGNLLDLAATELETRKASHEFICEGYAWTIANEGMRANDVSNSFLNGNLMTCAENEMKRLQTEKIPAWYDKIIDCIQDITGIDIRVSEYN